MTLPGISDTERADELQERRYQRKLDLMNAEEDFYLAETKLERARKNLVDATEKYVAHLEMMAAGVSK